MRDVYREFSTSPINNDQHHNRSRRSFLRCCSGAVLGVAMAPVFAKAASRERRLLLRNLHTGEHADTVYWTNGEYLEEGLQAINRVLRDHRSGDIFTMDPALIDMLFALRDKVESRAAFQIISGYRSPATNAMLRKKSKGVAKRSLHLKGKAVDVRLPGTDLKTLRSAALSLRAGGVGYYPKSNFIHVDTGRVRFW